MSNQAQEYIEVISEELASDLDTFAQSVLEVKVIKNEHIVSGVKLTRTVGGPTCWVDTDDQMLYCYWGGDFGYASVSSDVCDELNELFGYCY